MAIQNARIKRAFQMSNQTIEESVASRDYVNIIYGGNPPSYVYSLNYDFTNIIHHSPTVSLSRVQTSHILLR